MPVLRALWIAALAAPLMHASSVEDGRKVGQPSPGALCAGDTDERLSESADVLSIAARIVFAAHYGPETGRTVLCGWKGKPPVTQALLTAG